MEIELPYGKETIKVSVPDENVLEIIKPNSVTLGDDRATIYDAISKPINSKPFQEFIADAKDVLFIVNDATRPTPTGRILEILWEDIKNLNLKIIIATGTHRAPTEEELKFIFGDHLEDVKDKIYIHDAKSEEDLVYLDTTNSGTEVYLNKLVMEAQKINACWSGNNLTLVRCWKQL